MKFGQRVKEAFQILKSGTYPSGEKQRGTFLMPVTEYTKSYADIGGASVIAGVSVNPTTAMRLGVVFACVRLLSEQVASFELSVRKKSETKIEDLTGGTIHHLLHYHRLLHLQKPSLV